MISIFTDGSSRGNPGPGGWGAIIVRGDRVHEVGGADKHTTNNRMELTAAIRALESINDESFTEEPITIYTDSQYVSKGITEWIYTWQKNNWRTASRKSVENQDLWQILFNNTDGKEVTWKYVAGHSGHDGNERCDEIATSFADGMPVELYDGPREEYPRSLSF
jgi:ribonuclease HI